MVYRKKYDFDFRGADLFYHINKISWDSSMRTAHDIFVVLDYDVLNRSEITR